MSTEATLAPEPAPIVNDTLSAGDIMARFNSAPKEASPEPAPSSEPAPAPKSDPTPPAEPAPKVDTPLDDSGVETPLNDLDQKPAAETTTPEGDDGPPGNATPAAKYKWGELRKKADEFDKIQKEILPQKEAELAEWKKKAEELSKSDPSLYQKQLEEKEAAIAEYEKKLAVFDIQSTKQYQEEVAKPLAEIGTKLSKLASEYDIDLGLLHEAIGTIDPIEQDKKLIQLTEGMHPRHQNLVFDLAAKAGETFARSEELENNALEAKKEIEFLREQETKKQQEVRQKEVQVAAESVKKQFLSKIDLLKDEELSKRVFAAKLNPEDPVRQAYDAYAGELLPSLIKELHAARAKASELEKTLAARSAASPRAGGSGPAASAPPASEQQSYEGDTLWSRMRTAMQS